MLTGGACLAFVRNYAVSMLRRLFGRTGERVPVIGQGTWQMEDDDRADCIDTLRFGLDAGMTHIDTAEMYGDGYVEERIVADAIAGGRDEVFLTSKVLPQHASFKGTIAACERSLRRLRTDRLDLYLLHWRGSHPLRETIAAFETLVRDGKIRFWGVSNFDRNDLDDTLAVPGGDHVACDQVLYNLEERAVEQLVLPECEAQNIALVGYSPFGNGHFPSPSSYEARLLAEIGAHHGVSPRAVALAFLVRRPGLFAIPKAASIDHARDNADGGVVQLAPDELARIDAAFPAGPTPRSLPVL
jgi:diketogulonate reductase-like aldo/keto reductase